MVIIKREESVNHPSDTQKLIHTYLSILGLTSVSDLEYLKEQLLSKFNFQVDIKDLKLYFEPNLQEEITDLQLQMKNLNLNGYQEDYLN